MSVSKYIEEFNASIQKSIQKNLDKAEQNPYPSEEIKQIRESDPESALAKMFDENGQLIDPIGNQGLLFAAIDQDKDLYDRLRKGHRAKERLKNNERLENLDAEDYLNNNYLRFKQGLADVSSLGSNIDVNELLKPENLEDFEEIVEIGLDIDTSYVNNETVQSAFLEKMNSSQVEAVEEAEEAISPINPIESEDIQEEEEVTAGLAEPITEEESIATDIVAPTISALTLPEEQELSATINPINQPTESVEETEEVNEPSIPGSILNNQSETNIENTNVTNEEVSNSFISNLGDLTNLSTATESISNAINSVSSPLDILNNTSSGDVISAINDISSFLKLSNLNQNDTLNQVGDILNTEESFSLFSTLLNPSSIQSNVENIKNNFSNQESFEKFSNFSSFPTTELVKPEPVTKEDISKVGESISTGIGSKLAMPDLSNQGEMEGPSKREVRQAERQERKEERKEEKQGGSGTYVEGTNISSLEKRLKNIELLLQGPLEVKIKN